MAELSGEDIAELVLLITLFSNCMKNILMRSGREEWERLADAVPERISYFIERNKITAEEYLETKGQDYRNTPFLQVYGVRWLFRHSLEDTS